MSLQLPSLSRSCHHNLLTSWGCNRHWVQCRRSRCRPPPKRRRGSWRRRSSRSRPPPWRLQLGRTSSWPSGSRIWGTAAAWCSDCEVSGSPGSKPWDKLRHWYNTKTLVKDRRKCFYRLWLYCRGNDGLNIQRLCCLYCAVATLIMLVYLYHIYLRHGNEKRMELGLVWLRCFFWKTNYLGADYFQIKLWKIYFSE